MGLPGFENILVFRSRGYKISSSLSFYKRLRKISSKSKFDIVHLVNTSLLLPVLVKTDNFLRRSKLVEHVVMPYLQKPVVKGAGSLFSTIVFSRFVDAVIVTCAWLRSYVVERGINFRKVYIVPPLIDTKLYSPHSLRNHTWKPPFESPWLFYLGDLNPLRFPMRKMLISLKILKERGINVSLLVAARYYPGDLKRIQMMMQMASKMGLKGQIKAYNRKLKVKEKVFLFHTSDGVVFPFSSGATNVDPPISLLEAMSSGGVVITTSHRSIPEVVIDGVNGFLVDPLNSEVLSQVIEHVVQEGGCNYIRQQARNTIIRQFSQKVVSKVLLDVYTEILN
jgi:glycosyltransferase involved in cell wall biosynthesis